jgi:integrase
MRKRYKLTAAKVAAIKTPGRYGDGGNLILRVSPEGHKTFAFRYALDGRERTAGLGPVHRVSLASARERAEAMGRLLAAGLDPLDERNRTRAAERAAAARLITFREAAKRFLVDRDGGWRNEQHRRDFRNNLDTHILPAIGGLSVADVDTPAVLKVLEPIWRAKPETGSRVRSRIEMVLDWCAARDYRDGPNPAKWRGHLDHILPAPKTLAPTKHHPALPWQQVPVFMADLRGRDGVVARALEFTILTAARIGETLACEWSEIDFAAKTWSVPGHKMKSGRPHVVPLSPRALDILRSLPRDGERPFPTHRATTGAFLRQRMGRPDITTHGFRSSFSTWCAEATRFDIPTREAALAHVIKDKTVAAYQRGTMLAKRRQAMEAWAGYCASPPAKPDARVVAIARRA